MGGATTVGLDDGARRVGAVCRLTILHTPARRARGRFVVLERQPLELGRESVASRHLGLDDAALSRRHARFEPAGDGTWRVRDLGSRNGTFVEGRRVDEAPLASEALVRVGASLLLYEEIRLAPGERFVAAAPPLWGDSVALQRVRGEIERVGPRSVSVLILGETGVGKERVAEAVHRASGRDGAFVPVNCGGLPRDLVESELFGHVAGAFTGADRARPGLFAAADGGTLFLDEIGEMPPELQPKLLRALSSGEVRPVGSASPRQVDVRVVAATNRELEGRIAEGAFRGDLFARLAGWVIDLPPLRQRRADVLSLAPRLVPDLPEVHPDAVEALLLHPWPYNVRELEQLLSAAVVRSEGGPLGLDHLPEEVAALVRNRLAPSEVAVQPPLELLVRRDGTPDRDELATVLRHHRGNISRVASFFGRDRVQVYRWLGQHELDPEDFRGE